LTLDPGWKKFGPGIKHSGSATLIPIYDKFFVIPYGTRFLTFNLKIPWLLHTPQRLLSPSCRCKSHSQSYTKVEESNTTSYSSTRISHFAAIVRTATLINNELIRIQQFSIEIEPLNLDFLKTHSLSIKSSAVP
jgi:hypothetical protein